MKCPVWDCDEVLALDGGQFIMHGKAYTHGRCPVHGLIKFQLCGKSVEKSETKENKNDESRH